MFDFVQAWIDQGGVFGGATLVAWTLVKILEKAS